jgi:hypothetical protein
MDISTAFGAGEAETDGMNGLLYSFIVKQTVKVCFT